MQKNKVQFITKTALIAAAYTALTILFSWISYGEVQFRISEVLVLLVFIEPKYAFGLTLGCLLANLSSPFGIVDIAVGTLATFVAIMIIIGVRKCLGQNNKALIVASFGPVIANGIIVGTELSILLNAPLFITALYVAFGEFVVVTLLGTIIMRRLMKNEPFLEKIRM